MSHLEYESSIHPIDLLCPPLIIKGSCEVVVDLEVLGDNRLKWVPDLDPVEEPLTPVALVKVVLLLQEDKTRDCFKL